MNEEIGELILIRHGKSEIRNSAVDDTQRTLTQIGREELKKIIPELKANLRSDLELHLLSSPILRATQTAEIIADSIGNVEISQCQWISSGDFSVFQDELVHMKPPFCLIIVGHEPFLSDWSQKFSGNLIPYKKGMAVGFQIISLDPLKAVPKWIIQPKTLKLQDLKIRRGGLVLAEYQKILRFHLQEISRMQEQFIAAPYDQEVNHQLRVEIRAFRSILSFIKPLLNQREYSNVQDQLRELAQRFAHLREIDVLADEWSELLQIHPEVAGGT
jgi:phosphohistidine phosphatase